jgi:branched-chain amino acid transport system ATP-binding protein
MTALLQIANLTVPIGAQTVLRDVTLRVHEGKIVCLLGSNGVGKTTLMRTISGIYRNATGSIRFDGNEIINRPSHAIVASGIAQAPEGRHIFASMTVGDNLRVGGSLRSASETTASTERIFDLFPLLKTRLRQRAGSLSGGEQQMLCIGRALMARPRLLLLDEPSLGLAPLVVRSIFKLIGRIRDAGTSILMVEQNARAALAISDHAYLMDGGRIVLDGPAAEIAQADRVVSTYLGGAAAAPAA